jgi:hypothetical protein
MKHFTFRSLAVKLPVGLSLALAVACGGDDEAEPDGASGSAGSSASGSSNAGSTNNNAGSANTNGGSGNASGGSSSSGGGFSSSVSGDKPLSELTDAESTQVCKDLDSYYESSGLFDNLKEFNCRFAGMFAAAFAAPTTDAQARAACSEAYDECAAAPAEPTSQECTKPSASCTATVSELEACISDSTAVLSEVNDVFPSCAELTLADLEDSGSEPGEPQMSPASCESFEMKCPDGPSPPGAMDLDF